MSDLFVVAEAAQGYEGSADQARLLVRAAAAAHADAIKFQIVYADDLAQPGYEHYELFRSLELSTDDWAAVRKDAGSRQVAFLADIFGPQSLEVAAAIEVDGVKIHSSCFFDDDLVRSAIDGWPLVLLSIGGITVDELTTFLSRHEARLAGTRLVVLHGFQAEPTPVELNALARIAPLRERTGREIGFMDHSDGAGDDTVTLSAMALALGVRVFEKHLTLHRDLELEDHVSALDPAGFRTYVDSLRRLATAVGDGDLDLRPEELAYRARAVKRVVAARDLAAGQVVGRDDVTLVRPSRPAGMFDPEQAVGRAARQAIQQGDPIEPEHLA